MSNFSPSSQPPNTGEPEDWRAYWKLQGQPWRTDPEISSDRKTFLTQRLTFELSTRYYNYPFKDVDLARADVEWLLDFYKHKSEDLSDKLQQGHNDLNLSCANLRKVNLRSLPLEGVDFNQARLEGANLREAHLEGANLREAHLEGADLTWIYLEGAYLGGSYLERADLREANLEGAILNGAHLGKASLIGAFLNGADLHNAHLEGANLYRIRLEGANLQGVHLEGADLNLAQLEEADLREAHLEGTNLREAHLEGADLSGAFFDGVTNLKDAALGNEKSGMVFLAGVHWGEVDLSVVDWLHPKILGDEFQACQQNKNNGEKKDSATRLDEFRTAVRANRQLATVLHEQGLNEEAAHFAYRAQLLQRQVLRYRRNLGQYL